MIFTIIGILWYGKGPSSAVQSNCGYNVTTTLYVVVQFYNNIPNVIPKVGCGEAMDYVLVFISQ